MRIKKILSLVTLFLLVFSASACSLSNENNNKTGKSMEQADLSGKVVDKIDRKESSVIEEVVITIEGSKQNYNNTIKINSNDTVYDVLVKASNLNKLGLVTQEYDFGKSIEGIGNDMAGTDNKYWLYYVNGNMAEQSVDNQKVKNGDKVEFKFEKSSM